MEKPMSLITAAFPAYLLIGEVRGQNVRMWRVWLAAVAVIAPLASMKAGKAVHLAALGLSIALTSYLAIEE